LTSRSSKLLLRDRHERFLAAANDAQERGAARGDSSQLPLSLGRRFNRLPPDSHERTLVVHGEQDDTVPLAAVMDWARPQSLPVTVVPGGGHFFHGQLPLLKSLVVRHLRAG